MNFYQLAADLTVALHAAYVAFVLVGMVLILLGIALRWQWIRNFWFRVIHFLMIGTVAAEAVVGTVCPLTTLENALRQRAGQTVYEGTFLGRWAHWLLFYDAPDWVFTTGYCLFAGAVLVTLILAPPRRPWG